MTAAPTSFAAIDHSPQHTKDDAQLHAARGSLILQSEPDCEALKRILAKIDKGRQNELFGSAPSVVFTFEPPATNAAVPRRIRKRLSTTSKSATRALGYMA